MALSINTTNIQLDVERSPSGMYIDTQPARLDLSWKQTKVDITSEKPMVVIDQYECFATAGLKNNYDLTKAASQAALQQALEYIGKTASDGAALAAIENGGNPIKAIAVRDAYPEHVFGIDFIPKTGPKIDIIGSTDIEWERNWEGAANGVDGEYSPGSININYEPSILNIYVKQYPSVNIEYQGSSIDTKI